ncbi:hypothetical protein CASFOL_041944 [Castilleja foliolosa]|uniref:Proteasome subunit beta n=1 Tax=Castilleja foliolosa TaxID=1961234 RepID=A0ABD3BAH6_9LAMI
MSIPAESEDISTGTVNCFVLLKDGVVVGVDSRTSSTRLDKETNKEYRVLKTDEAEKVKVIGPGVLLTSCGNVDRKFALWDYLKKMKRTVNCFVLLKDGIIVGVDSRSYSSRKDNETNKEYRVLATDDGKKVKKPYHVWESREKFVAYYMGDGEMMERYTKDTNDPFYAIGSGSGFEKLTWGKTDDSDSVVIAVSEALVNVSLEDPCYRGLLRMRWVDERNYYKHQSTSNRCHAQITDNTDLSNDYFDHLCRLIKNYDPEDLRFTSIIRFKNAKNKEKKNLNSHDAC